MHEIEKKIIPRAYLYKHVILWFQFFKVPPRLTTPPPLQAEINHLSGTETPAPTLEIEWWPPNCSSKNNI